MLSRLIAVMMLAGGAMAMTASAQTKPSDRPFYVGGDVAMLPELEKAGAVYSDDGKQDDALAILARRGANLFRLRVFVNPDPDFNARWGAVQDLGSMVALGMRIKATGAKLLISIHYSDTWADPEHQHRPAGWVGLTGPALEAKVEQYTTEVVTAFKSADAPADWVQVGNEITGGMLWPDGKVIHKGTDDEKAESWTRFTRLMASGVRAVRRTDPAARVVIHIHGGADPGLPQWFFKQVTRHKLDYDVIGLSYYPAFGAKLPNLKKNLADLEAQFGKDIMIVETSYPHSPLTDLKDRTGLTYPETEPGQADFWQDLVLTARASPRCLGILWWYPEARPAGDRHIWRGGAEALFNNQGRLLRAGQQLLPNPR